MKPSDTFSSQIRDFYGDKKLSPESVDRIVGIGKSDRKVSVRSFVVAALSAAAVVAAFFAITMKGSVTARAFDEVAVHHRMELQPDILTADWAEAESGLSKLGFPLSPLPEELTGIELEGARYCSVLSHPAAQLKVMRDGRRGTLYVVPGDGELKGIRDKARDKAEVRVECWRTADGRLFLLAESLR